MHITQFNIKILLNTTKITIFKNKIARMNDQSDHFPVLGIQEFNQGTPADCDLLFHELHGENLLTPHKHDFLSFSYLKEEKVFTI